MSKSEASNQLRSLAGVPKTLCIPLWARAQAAALTPHLTDFDDPQARVWCEEIGVDPAWIRKDAMILKSCIARARRLDDITKKFLTEATDQPVTVLSIGAGLCSRMDRLGLTPRIQAGDPDLQWIDLDLPEVISLRSLLRPAAGGHSYISKSLTDRQWPDSLPVLRGRKVLVLIEGVLVYIPAGEVRTFFRNSAEKIAAAGAIELRFAFDVLDGPAFRGSRLSSSIRQAGAKLRWAPWDLQGFLERAHAGLNLRMRHDLVADLRGLLPALHSLYRLTRRIPAYSVAEIKLISNLATHP